MSVRVQMSVGGQEIIGYSNDTSHYVFSMYKPKRQIYSLYKFSALPHNDPHRNGTLANEC